MPPPRKASTAEKLEAEELQSSPSREAVDLEDVGESTSKARRDRSRHRNEKPERSGRPKQTVSKTKGLPPGWLRKESKSKPGVYYYAHPATNHTQTELPMDIYAGLEAAAGASEKPAHALNGKILGPPSASPVDKLKMVAEEAEKKRKEAEEAKKFAQEKALRKKREFDHTLKRVQAEEAAEEAGQEEELRKVRARRQEKTVESAKAAELDHSEPREDEEGARKEMLRARLNEARVEKERGRKRPAGLCFGQSVPEAREKSPEPPPPKKEPSKKELKEMKKRKAAEKLGAKEAKKLKKKKDKQRKEKKQLKKAEKKVRKSAKMLKKVKAGRFSSVSSSASSSSSSSGS